MPPELRHVWDFFTDIFNPGGYGMGPFRALFTEIEAYSRVTRNIILPTEAFIIRDLCEEFMKAQAEKEDAKKRLPAGAKPIKNLTKMNDTDGLKRLFGAFGTKEYPAVAPKKAKPKAPPEKAA
jgi:hypothetical protein